jgi:hypothetical protein
MKSGDVNAVSTPESTKLELNLATKSPEIDSCCIVVNLK